MLVVYDLRYASDHFAGIGTYAFALFQELLELPGDERYLALWCSTWPQTRHDFGPVQAHPRVEWIERPFHPVSTRGAVQVGRWLREVKPDVYFTPFSLRPWGSGRPEAVTVHDVAPLRMRPPLVKYWMYRLSLVHAIRARAVVTVSEFSRQEIVALTGAPAARVHAVLQGIMPWPAGLVPRKPAALDADRFALLIGDNRPRKNIAVVLRAWAALGEQPPLALVTGGPVHSEFPAPAELARAAGARRVIHLGWLDPAELAWLYTHAEMLVLPSVYEGFGLPLAEAFAHGLPALTSDVPVFREVAAGAAVHVDPHDPSAWAGAVLALANDPARREALRRAGLARASELTYRATAQGVLPVLREAARG